MVNGEKQSEGARKTLSSEELQKVRADFEGKPPAEVLKWALDTFHPQIALACSFGAEDLALVDMVTKVRPDARIFYLDTNLLFPETYAVCELIAAHYAIKLERYATSLTLKEQARTYSDKLWQKDPDLCCNLRKVEPLKEALSKLDAWVTGIRRDQAPTRANAGIVEFDQKFNLIKINPLVSWTWEQVWKYIRENGVPYNTLHDQGYPSIGCEPCTKPVKPGEDPRAGRWSGQGKIECGLHQ